MVSRSIPGWSVGRARLTLNQDKRRRFDSYPGSMSTTSLTVIVLAAGGGTRMRSKTMKVLHPVGGRSMIGHVLAAVQAVAPRRIVAGGGPQREQGGPHLNAPVPPPALPGPETPEGTRAAG